MSICSRVLKSGIRFREVSINGIPPFFGRLARACGADHRAVAVAVSRLHAMKEVTVRAATGSPREWTLRFEVAADLKGQPLLTNAYGLMVGALGYATNEAKGTHLPTKGTGPITAQGIELRYYLTVYPEGAGVAKMWPGLTVDETLLMLAKGNAGGSGRLGETNRMALIASFVREAGIGFSEPKKLDAPAWLAAWREQLPIRRMDG